MAYCPFITVMTVAVGKVANLLLSNYQFDNTFWNTCVGATPTTAFIRCIQSFYHKLHLSLAICTITCNPLLSFVLDLPSFPAFWKAIHVIIKMWFWLTGGEKNYVENRPCRRWSIKRLSVLQHMDASAFGPNSRAISSFSGSLPPTESVLLTSKHPRLP